MAGKLVADVSLYRWLNKIKLMGNAPNRKQASPTLYACHVLLVDEMFELPDAKRYAIAHVYVVLFEARTATDG